MKKPAVAAALTLMLVVAATFRTSTAQESAQAEKAPNAYRLDFSVSELEDGKKINSRQYSMNVKSPDANEIKIGTRVPVEGKQSEFQYLDVGTNIWCRLKDQADVASLGNNVMLNVRAELSNFAVPEQQGQNMRPTIRQMKIESSTVATVGKPMVIGSVDDPNSKRQFQLEVTVTKLR